MLDGSGKAGEPSWARVGNSSPSRRKDSGGLPPGFSRRRVIDLAGSINFGPHRIGNQLIVGIKDADEFALSFTAEGEAVWAALHHSDPECIKDVVGMKDGVMIYSHVRDKASARIISWRGELLKKRLGNLRRTLWFQPNLGEGGVFMMNERGWIGKWPATGWTDREITVVQTNLHTGEMFLTDAQYFYFKEIADQEDRLWCYHINGKRCWQEPFGKGRGLKFADAFLGAPFDPYHADYKGMLFVSTQDAWVFALEIATGEVVWDTKGPLKHVSGPVLLQPAKGILTERAVDEAHIFVSNPEQGAISAVSLYSQIEEKKPFPFGFSGSGGFSRPAALGDTIWMAATCRNGYAYIFKRGGGQIGHIETKVTRPFEPVYLGNNSFVIPTADQPTEHPNQLTIFGFE